MRMKKLLFNNFQKRKKLKILKPKLQRLKVIGKLEQKHTSTRSTLKQIFNTMKLWLRHDWLKLRLLKRLILKLRKQLQMQMHIKQPQLLMLQENVQVRLLKPFSLKVMLKNNYLKVLPKRDNMMKLCKVLMQLMHLLQTRTLLFLENKEITCSLKLKLTIWSIRNEYSHLNLR